MFPSEVDWWIGWSCARNTTLDPKIQKNYKSRDTNLCSVYISIFHWKSETYVISRNTDMDCILILFLNL